MPSPTPSPRPQDPPTRGPAGQPILDLSSINTSASTGPVLMMYRPPKSIDWGALPITPGQLESARSGVTTRDDAVLEFYRWGPKGQQEFARDLYEKGLIESPYDLTSAQKVWEDAVNAATSYYDADNPMTPHEILDNAAALKKAAAGIDDSKTQINTAINVMGEAEAKQLVRSIFEQGLGRAPTAEELETYASQVVAASEERPSVTTMTQTRNSSGGVDTRTVSTPGYTAYDAREDMQTRVEADPEYGIYQAATTYWNALEDL